MLILVLNHRTYVSGSWFSSDEGNDTVNLVPTPNSLAAGMIPFYSSITHETKRKLAKSVTKKLCLYEKKIQARTI